MKNRHVLLGVFAALLMVAALSHRVFSQGRGGNADDPFVGVTTNGAVIPGLFHIQATGVSTAPVRRAAEAFLASLSEEQRQATMFSVDDKEWRLWNNIHRAARQGVSFQDMSERQRELAFDMMRAGLSAQGFRQSQDIMKLNETIAELTGRHNEYGQWLYWITVMGTPSDTQPWGWQIDGHHLDINYFILGDQVVMTPAFMGSEPVRADSGKFAGTVVLQNEEKKGHAVMASLTEEQRAKAVIETSKTGNNSLAQAFRDNLVLDYAGLRASEMTAAQKELLLAAVAEFVGHMDDGHAKVKMAEVREHLGDTWFAWIGGTRAEDVFYYRIQSPVVLIEFDHQTPVALPGPRVPGRIHVHTVIRTPNGNDYGKDLLRQHYQRSHGLSAGPLWASTKAH